MRGGGSFISRLANNFLNGGEPKSYINDIPLEVISDKSRSLPVAVTNRRVEKGFNITDTTRREQQIINITVVDNSEDYLKHRERLEMLQAKGDYVTFYFSDNRDTYENMIIENIEEIENNSQKEGFTFHITLRQIKVATLSTEDVNVDYKALGSSGGPRKHTTAVIRSATPKEEKAVEKTLVKSSFDGFLGVGNSD